MNWWSSRGCWTILPWGASIQFDFVEIIDVVNDDGPPDLPRHQLEAMLIGIGSQGCKILFGLFDEILDIRIEISCRKSCANGGFV
jgi:hypothetical protein